MTIDTILITDTETQGLVPSATCQAIEVAIIVWDVATASERASFSSLIHATENPCESINRIGVAMLAKAPPAEKVWARVGAFVREAGEGAVFMAHRAEFDRGFYPPTLAAELRWVCSKFDVEWPRSALGASCVQMALDHDVPVTSAHRAMTDARLIAGTLRRAHELGSDVPTMLARAMRPKVLFEVADKSFSEERNALAKAAGFAWNAGARSWQRKMCPADVSALGFPVRELP
jgi:DNA polymerase III epsilon subunit-like protein